MTETRERFCTRCKRHKETDQFYPSRRVCKSCINEMQQNKQRKKDAPIAGEAGQLLRGWGR